MEDRGTVPKAVFIKQEPGDGSEDEASHEPEHFSMLKEEIKVEVGLEGMQPACVKQEPTTAARSDAGATVSTATRDAEKNPYTCDQCGKQFKEIYFYIPHMQQHEHSMEMVEESVSKQTKYPCDTRDKVFTSKSGLYQQKFSCKYCDKQFTWRSYLNTHERIHTKPYSCYICKKQFAETFALMTHIATYHTGEKPYGCKQCGKKFAQLSDLAKHTGRERNKAQHPEMCA